MNVVHKYKDDNVARCGYRMCQTVQNYFGTSFANIRQTIYMVAAFCFHICVAFFLYLCFSNGIAQSYVDTFSISIAISSARYCCLFVFVCFVFFFFYIIQRAIGLCMRCDILKLIIKYTAGAGGRNDFGVLRFYFNFLSKILHLRLVAIGGCHVFVLFYSIFFHLFNMLY